MDIITNRLFVERYRIEISRDGEHLEFALWFEADLEALAERLDWPPADVHAQFLCEARDIGRELFAGLAVEWTSFHDVAHGARGDFYRAAVGCEEMVLARVAKS